MKRLLYHVVLEMTAEGFDLLSDPESKSGIRTPALPKEALRQIRAFLSQCKPVEEGQR